MEKERLYNYFSGDTSAEEEREIMEWAEASPENYEIYLKERKWWNAVLVHLPSSAWEDAPAAGKSKKVNLWMITTVAATIALLFSLSYTLFFTEKPEERWQTIWVPAGQRAQVILDDSTVVWLNSRSTLKYPVSFQSDVRKVQLDGEGYFEVKENKEKPFVVQTEKYKVEVLGTHFNVFAYGHTSIFETSLIEGAVRILQNDSNRPLATLKPNEKVMETDGRLTIGKIQSFDHFRWREGLICIDEEPFDKLIEKFSLYFDITIKVENPALLEYRPTGKFRHSDGIDHALKVLQRDVNFVYTRNSELNEIVIK